MAKTPQVHLTAEEHREVEKNFDAIKAVLKKKNVDVANIIGLVTEDQVQATAGQVKVKFAEEVSRGMNMIAFD